MLDSNFTTNMKYQRKYYDFKSHNEAFFFFGAKMYYDISTDLYTIQNINL